jgi:hypothetical protein
MTTETSMDRTERTSFRKFMERVGVPVAVIALAGTGCVFGEDESAPTSAVTVAEVPTSVLTVDPSDIQERQQEIADCRQDGLLPLDVCQNI